MYLRGRLVARGLADACVTLEVRALPFRREALRRRDRSERRERTNAMRSNPSATPGPTTAGSPPASNEGRARESFRRLRLEAEAVDGHRRRNREERPHSERLRRASVTRGGAAIRLTRGPPVSLRRTVVVVVEAVQVDLHHVSDDAPGHEFPEPDRPTEAR